MKHIIAILVLLLPAFAAIACPVCERQQPKLLKGITHGVGPQGDWDYLIVAAMSIVVLVTLFFSLKWLIRPGEQSKNHIKHSFHDAD